MRKGIIEQVIGLVFDTIRPAMSEDFSFKSKQEAEETLDYLKELVNDISVDDIYTFEEEE
jgi:hypothetical protein